MAKNVYQTRPKKLSLQELTKQEMESLSGGVLILPACQRAREATRNSLEAAGLEVIVAAATTETGF